MNPLKDPTLLSTLSTEKPVEEKKSLIVTDATRLTVKSEPFNFKDPQMDPMELAKLLVEQMVDNGGLGLSAIQIGIPLRVAAIRARPQNIVMFNPIIVDSSEETNTEVEGCLSFPGMMLKIKRPFEIRVRFRWPNQEVQTEKWGGLTSRVVQHEIDHMDGLLFYNKVGKFHRDQAFRKMEQWKRAVRDHKKSN